MIQPADVFAPGCALSLYKPHLAQKLLDALKLEPGFNDIKPYELCCHNPPATLPSGTRVINVCSGCDRRYRSLYEGISTKSLWEIFAESQIFPFPDYGGAEISIHDTCPTRTQKRVTSAVRVLLGRMNFKLIEPERTMEKGPCCGDSFHKRIPISDVLEKMRKRASEMPCDEVAVYCVSCIKSIHNGGKKPRYLTDLLFREETVPGETNPDIWHKQLEEFIEKSATAR